LAQQGIVQIGCSDNNHFQGSHNGLLINLSEKVPEFFSRYERVAEIVVQDVTITNRTRANYRFYRDRGYPLETHNLRK
jgi:DNA polymerase-3 subunit chi